MRHSDVDKIRSYEQPVWRKLTSNQAVLFLVAHAYVGDQGARELLELLFPEPAESRPSHGMRTKTPEDAIAGSPLLHRRV